MNSMQPGHLELRACVDSAKGRLALAGELDLASAPKLEAAIARLCEHGVQELILELQELAFVDSTGLRAMLEGRRTCEEHGCVFFLSGAQPQARRLIEIAGLGDALPFREIS